MGDYLEVANHSLLWLAAIPMVIIAIVQAIIFIRRAFKARETAGLSQQEANQALRVGLVSSIGPALGVFVVMLGLMSIIGAPLAWMRLSVIGAAPTELAAATQAANAMGVELGGEGYGLIHFANAAWVMALNGSAWLLFTGLFTHKLEGLNQKISKGDPKRVGIISSAAMCGAFAYLVSNQLFIGIDHIQQSGNLGYIASLISAGIAMLILNYLSNTKFPKLAEFNLGLAMIVGMVVGVIFQ